jgi:vacuolar-type H+-ATPase subunit E/Vma4
MAELRNVVASRGRERVATLRRDAEAEASRLLEAAESEIGRETTRRLEAARASIERETGARIAAARASGRRRVLLAREVLLERVFAKALELAQEEPAGAGAEGWTVQIEQAVAQLPPGPVTLFCSPRVAEAIGNDLDRDGLRIEIDGSLCGFRAVGAEGRVTIDASTSALLERDRPALAIEVLRQLTGEGRP